MLAYNKLSLLYHPDKRPSTTDKEEAILDDQYQLVKAAYEILLDTEKRKHFESVKDPSSSLSRESVQYPIDYGGDTPSNIKIMRPWLYGLGMLIIAVGALGISVSESRAQATERAWDMYEEERTKDGLGHVLGYTKENKKFGS